MSRRKITQFVCGLFAAALAACGSVPVGPGFYQVSSGDTVTKIARSTGQSVQNIVRWNNLSNPDSIEVGQLLRVAPPASAPGANPGAASGSGRAAGNASNSPAAGPRESGASSPSSAAAAPPVKPTSSIALVWPAPGKVARGFNGVNSKGIDIVNTAGTPVVAAAAGTVMYAGNGLRGYGNLLIIKHNADFLTAYAHNRTLNVKEGQRVTQGEKIAEMGDSDNDRVALHFELRYGGRSIDPGHYLPSR